MSSLKKNYIYNLLNTLSGILFPIITLPYVLRLLQPEGIGTIDFLNSIINYVVLLTNLGIPVYAVKEIAKYRDDIHIRNKTTIEIILLSLFLVFIGYIVILLLSLNIPQIKENILIYFVLSFSVLFNSIGVQWFYQAVEDFKFITFRALIVRIISLLCLFMFVKSKNDLLIYACITVFSTVGNNIFNTIFFFKKHISIKQFLSYKDLNLIRHLKPSLQLFALNLIISIYINLDTIMLGFMKGNQVVGYYSSAVKFYRVLFSIVTSLGVVMLPRFSNIVQNNDSLEFKRLINKSLSFTLMISLPLCLGLIILSKSIIILFGGQSYEPSIITLQILSPIIVLAGITNVIGIQIFYPNNKQNLLIISVLMGAIVNIILNYNLIPKFSHNGAAFSTLIAELIVFLFQLFFLIKYMSFNIFKKEHFNYVLASLIMGLVVWFTTSFEFKNWINIILSVLTGGIFYMGFLYLKKDKLVREICEIKLRKR